METWERDTLKNLYDYFRQIDWIELPENLGEFWERLPEIYLDERGLTLSVVYDQHELVLGFGEYGGGGQMWDGQMYWQTYTHKNEPTNWEFGGYVANGSPMFVWWNTLDQLSEEIKKLGANNA